jgi:glycerophosphoryl diester phosphodiesterase
MLMTWPVASPEEARRLAAWGVDGVITERYDLA